MEKPILDFELKTIDNLFPSEFDKKMFAVIAKYYPYTQNNVREVWGFMDKSWDKTILVLKMSMAFGTTLEDVLMKTTY